MDTLLLIVLVSVAGPIIGSLIGVIRKPSDLFMFNMFSFAAGVMLSISFLELIPHSIALSSIWVCVIGVMAGAGVMYLLDKVIPHIHQDFSQEHGRNLNKTATFLFVGMFLHNFPEGMAIAIGAVSDLKVSLAIAVAIAIHHIPEGICTSTPYYRMTGKRLKSFLLSSSTAIPTLAGFLFAHYLYQSIPVWVVGAIIAATAGLMIYISSDELIPSSCRQHTNHSTIFSLMLGILFVLLLGML